MALGATKPTFDEVYLDTCFDGEAGDVCKQRQERRRGFGL
jgi:hypothetical protein